MGKTSGKLVVILLFCGAFLLTGILFSVAYRQKLMSQANIAANNASEYTDSAMTNTEIRTWTAQVPNQWVKVTFVEGQGYVIYTPCYSHNSVLEINPGSDSNATIPNIQCDYCDNTNEYRISSIGKLRRDSSYEFNIVGENGNTPLKNDSTVTSTNGSIEKSAFKIMNVTDSLQQQFGDAPFKEKVLLWARANEVGKIDTLLFIPKAQESEFESLKAEDENPEGCKEEPGD